MNPKQEIVDVFDGHPGDTPPPAVFTQTGTVGQMDACGSAWPEANDDPGMMAALCLRFSEVSGMPVARVPYDITVEASVLGATIKEGSRDIQPSVLDSPFRSADGIMDVPDGLPSPDEFASSGRCAVVAEAAGRVSREREDLFLTCGLQDAISVAMQLLGPEETFMGLLMEPERVTAWIRRAADYCDAYSARLSEPADNLTIVAGGSGDLFSPDMFAEFSEPYLRRQVSVIGTNSTIHMCGETRGILEDLASIGASGLSLEASHDPEGMLAAVRGRTLMFGSVDPIRTLLQGTPADVAAQARRYAELGFDIITPECGIAPRTPDENIRALGSYRAT